MVWEELQTEAWQGATKTGRQTVPKPTVIASSVGILRPIRGNVLAEPTQIGGAEHVDVIEATGFAIDPITAAINQLRQSHPDHRLLRRVRGRGLGRPAEGETSQIMGLGIEQKIELSGFSRRRHFLKLGIFLENVILVPGRAVPCRRRVQGDRFQILASPTLGRSTAAQVSLGKTVTFGHDWRGNAR